MLNPVCSLQGWNFPAIAAIEALTESQKVTGDYLSLQSEVHLSCFSECPSFAGADLSVSTHFFGFQ